MCLYDAENSMHCDNLLLMCLPRAKKPMECQPLKWNYHMTLHSIRKKRFLESSWISIIWDFRYCKQVNTTTTTYDFDWCRSNNYNDVSTLVCILEKIPIEILYDWIINNPYLYDTVTRESAFDEDSSDTSMPSTPIAGALTPTKRQLSGLTSSTPLPRPHTNAHKKRYLDHMQGLDCNSCIIKTRYMYQGMYWFHLLLCIVAPPYSNTRSIVISVCCCIVFLAIKRLPTPALIPRDGSGTLLSSKFASIHSVRGILDNDETPLSVDSRYRNCIAHSYWLLLTFIVPM